MAEEKKQRLPEVLKKTQFKKGNQLAVGSTTNGRPKSLNKTEIENATLEDLRVHINNRANWDNIVRVMYENAFVHPNKDGTVGRIAWAKFFMSYAVGMPPVKVETEHTNKVDLMRMMIEQSIKENEVTIDVEPTEVEDD